VTISPPISLAALLKRDRLATGLTQEELAERAKVSVRAISDLERGVRQAPHKDTLTLLIAAMGLSAEDAEQLRDAARRTHSRRTAAPAAAVAGKRAGAALTEIPTSLTALIGREHEEGVIVHALTATDIRLLTLTGPAGIGKTRLAEQVALNMQGAFRDGVVFIPLTPVSDDTLVLSTVAQALGLREDPGASLFDTLRLGLAGQERLLVLDNFEHVVEAAPSIVAVLGACPRVRALVTSRAALRVRGEHEFAVPPLDIPNLDHLPPLEDLARYAAIALFVRRAQATCRTFALTAESARAVAAICVRLDGLPLAIELAAARIKVLTPQALLARLESGLSLLTRGAVDLPEQQRTMRHAISWSYDLLTTAERELFQRLAIFAGGWTLEGAEAICAEDGDRGASVLDQLTALVDKNLVVAGDGVGGEPRFRLLELIREYAREQLTAAGEEAALRRRHAEYFLAFAEMANTRLSGASQAAWFSRLSEEHANLRAALAWATESGSGAVELGLRLAAALWWFWQVRNHAQEGRVWLERLLQLQREPDSAGTLLARAEALRGAGNLAWFQGDFAPARPLLEESLALYRRAGADGASGQANTLVTLGLVADELGEWGDAVTLFEEAIPLFSELGDTNQIAKVHNNLAVVAYRQERYPEAIHLYEQSLALHRQTGDTYSIGLTLANLAESVQLQGNVARAAELLAQSLAVFEELSDKDNIAYVLSNLSSVVRQQGDYMRALDLYRQSLTMAREVSAKRSVYAVLDEMAELAGCLHRSTEALQLFALSTKLRVESGISRSQGLQAQYESGLASAHAQLGAADSDILWEVGRRLTLDDVESIIGDLERAAAPESS
jgi:predicted ATPase/transcriptional regulator with XRE-family HTH domain